MISQREARRTRAELNRLRRWLLGWWNSETPHGAVFCGAVELNDYQRGRMQGALDAMHHDAVIVGRREGATINLYVLPTK